MKARNIGRLFVVVSALAMSACVDADKAQEPAAAKPAKVSEDQAEGGLAKAEGQVLRGWYMEHEWQGMFQPCGESRQWRVDSPELRARAKDFGLDPDTPVYVSLSVTQTAGGHELLVSRIEQFGSPTPVRDCAMTGVVLPAPTGG